MNALHRCTYDANCYICACIMFIGSDHNEQMGGLDLHAETVHKVAALCCHVSLTSLCALLSNTTCMHV